MTVRTLPVTKHHGLGNDFCVWLDLDGTGSPLTPALARAVCDRHRGIGADGLIRATRPESPAEAALAFELRNANGSEAETSGNGLRCLAQAAFDAGVIAAGHPFVVLTPAGRRTLALRVTEAPTIVWVSVDMGVAHACGDDQRCNVGHGTLRVDMGNPHLVMAGPDPATMAVDELGPSLETSVPGGQNVEFVALGPGPDEITMRVWERGAGETLACGSGACAAAVAFHRWGRVGPRVTVHQPGGDADVELHDDGTVVLSGPSQRIATCAVEVDDR
jgi:diaminopimelate epimerase